MNLEVEAYEGELAMLQGGRFLCAGAMSGHLKFRRKYSDV